MAKTTERKQSDAPLPDSSRIVGNERVGIMDSGYLDKKGTPSGESAMFNKLPPGQNIENQEVCDIRAEKQVEYRGGISFPGDGWT